MTEQKLSIEMNCPFDFVSKRYFLWVCELARSGFELVPVGYNFLSMQETVCKQSISITVHTWTVCPNQNFL